MEDTKRGSGRTTRMFLDVVKQLAIEPHSWVVVVMHDGNAVCWAKQWFSGLLKNTQLARIVFMTYNQYLEGHARGVRGGENPFIDHHAAFVQRGIVRSRILQLQVKERELQGQEIFYDA